MYCGGIDVGGTKIASALFSREGEISAREKVPIDKAGGDAAAAQVAGRIQALAAAAAESGGRLAAVGICVPGIAYSASGKVWAPNIPGWDQYPLLEKVGAEYRRRIFPSSSNPTGALTSPARPGAAPRPGPPTPSSWPSGRASGPASSPAAASSTATRTSPARSAGSASIPTSKPSTPSWAVSKPKPRAIPWPVRPGSDWGGGERRRWPNLAGGRVEDVTAEVVAAAARAGDALALEIVAEAVAYLGMGIANIVSLLNPEIVVVGGGLFHAADVLLEPVRREVGRWAQPLAARAVRIELSGLGEDAGLYGCGKLAWETVDKTGE
ncbi:MAG: ROK family protein [Candidatus Moduliflexus flocculans]|nr:ROK family protein [Candidatus Moduliflexus flocculans]